MMLPAKRCLDACRSVPIMAGGTAGTGGVPAGKTACANASNVSESLASIRKKNRPLREGRGVRSEAQQQPAPGGADKAQEIKRYVGPFYVEVGFVCLDALAGRITHSSKLERLIR